MKRILCIADSLGLPRLGVDYEQTWLAILRNKIVEIDFIAAFRRNATTDVLSSGGDYGDTLLFYKPQVVILQLGICDCAPRYLRSTSLAYRLLYRAPKNISKLLWKLIKFFVKRRLDCTEVSVERFSENLVDYFDQCIDAGVEKVIVLKIAKPGEIMVQENPQILLAIERYNQVYEHLAEQYKALLILVDPLFEGKEFYYVADGYHPNCLGNRLVADALISKIMNNV